MISQETFDGLKSIGLNLYERKLYTALIARSTATVGELSELAAVPRSRAYDVLESLAEKGFVVIQNTKPLKYVAVAPSEALERAKKVLKNNFASNITRIDKLSQSSNLKELENLYTSGISLVDPADLSGSFKGEHSLNLQLNTHFKNASESIDIITTSSGIKSLHENHSGLLQKAKNNGVKIRIAAPINDSNKSEIKSLSEFAEIKDIKASKDVHKLPAGRMVIVDGKHVMMGLTDDSVTHPTQEVSFWSASPHFAKNFAQGTFNLIWEHL